jgi:hypothetical protein
MQISYVGPFVEGVVVPLGFGAEIFCGQGEVIEVDDELGANLLEQPTNWQPVTPAPTPQAPVSSPAPTPAPEPVPAPDVTPPTTPAADTAASTTTGN